jgi:hypothetical protein
MNISDSLTLTYLHPTGLTVRGAFDAAPAPVEPRLQTSFLVEREKWLRKIANNPKSFNGHRAVLTGFEVTAGELHLQTAYRTYADGRALHDALRVGRSSGVTMQQDWFTRPRPELSWGFSLLTAVLLPGGKLLCNQRSQSMAVNPGKWSPFFTEIIEPSDVEAGGMQGLLDRLVAEELAPLRGLGSHKCVGVGVRPQSYTWQLFSVLDLREAPGALQALEALAPDDETMAWGELTLAAADTKGQAPTLPAHFLAPVDISPDEIRPLLEFLSLEKLSRAAPRLESVGG